MSLRILIFNGDLGGCFQYRVLAPMDQLAQFGVSWVALPELPNSLQGEDFSEICRLIAQFDLVVVQRCYKLAVVKIIKTACDLLGKKMVFETDDDYLNLPPTNPCYPEMVSQESRAGYVEVLKMADMITVSTKELKDTLYMFNKNIVVLPNAIKDIFCGSSGEVIRAHGKEQIDENGKVQISNNHGLVSCPSYFEKPDKSRQKVIRIGYTGTPSHHEDFGTIYHALEKFMDKHNARVWLIFIGDKWFYDQMSKGKGRIIFIPVSQYSLYMYHLRNLDIGLAPLTPNLFNMSKSPIKAIEYGSWGVPAVLPHYVTYTRTFTNRFDCLTYYNSGEFFSCLEELTFNDDLRNELGRNARDTVNSKCLERHNSRARYEAYLSLVTSGGKVKQFTPVKGAVV